VHDAQSSLRMDGRHRYDLDHPAEIHLVEAQQRSDQRKRGTRVEGYVLVPAHVIEVGCKSLALEYPVRFFEVEQRAGGNCYGQRGVGRCRHRLDLPGDEGSWRRPWVVSTN